MSRWSWFKGPHARCKSWAGFCIPPGLQAVTGQHESLSISESLDLAQVESFLNNLRRWSPRILASCDSPEETAGMQMQLESFALWLRQVLLYFQPHYATKLSDLPSLHRAGFGGQKRYSDSQLVGMVLFAWHLRDSAALREAMPSAIEAIFPNFFSNTAIVQGRHALKQSRSLLRNAQLAVDLALMLVRRQRLAESGKSSRYGWADSSAVAKSDWLISKPSGCGRKFLR